MPVRRRAPSESDESKTCLSKPSVYHAAVVIFLEFFAFGLLTTPMISVLDETFPQHTFLMNGIIQGIKGFLSFLSAPLLGALSDALGRKPFLLLTVTFTCSPIPLMKISPWWYFAMISISGMFAVTFSVVLAYVADITTEEERSWAYGLVSATFAASLVSSPAIGAYLGRVFNEELVVALATAIALLDILFIIACVPESLPEKVRLTHGCTITRRSNSGCSVTSGSGSTSSKISWDKVDPFAALRKVTNDYLVLILCITTFFSYLPEAGQYSCFFIYLRLVMGFSEENVALFIAIGGILSCISQTFILGLLNTVVGPKRAIIIGLVLEAVQLTLYGLCTEPVLLWTAGLVAAMGTVTYPALSAFVSKHASADQQGVAQGLVTGIRGLCGGLGPALFGLIFYIFRVDLNSANSDTTPGSIVSLAPHSHIHGSFIPGPPFAFGAILVLMAILVAYFIPENPKSVITGLPPTPSTIDSGISGPILFDLHAGSGVNRLRRHSPPTSDIINELGPDYIEQIDDSNASLLDGNRKAKSGRVISKDHIFLTSNRDAGVWGRWFSYRPSSDRRRYPLAHRRSTRLFPHPTVSFTRAHFIEPFRRFFTGLSSSLTPVPPTGDNSMTSQSHKSLSLGLTEFGSQFGSNLMNSDLDYVLQSRHEAEAADLSNYRGQYMKQFLITPMDIHPTRESAYCATSTATPLLTSCSPKEDDEGGDGIGDRNDTGEKRICFLNDFHDGTPMADIPLPNSADRLIEGPS